MAKLSIRILLPAIAAVATFVAAPAFGAAWQYFTGSKEHNVQLRSRARDLGCATIHPGFRHLTRAQVEASHAAGLPVLVWTVNDPVRAVELRGWGVDSLISDVPGAIAAAIA